MRKRIAILALLLALACGIPGCGGADRPDPGELLSRYDVSGLFFLSYTDIDTVCDTPELAEAGGNLLAGLEDSLLLSFVVDSSIELTGDELGGYDHLVITNPRWVERFGSPDRLKPVEYGSLTEEMRAFLEAQMPILTADGSVLPHGAGLYEYEGGALLAFPVNVTLGWDEAIEAERPLIILADRPAKVFGAKSCMLPLTSSGNVLFADGGALQRRFEESGLADYGGIRPLDGGAQEENSR